MMDMTFRRFLELSTVGSGVDLTNKKVIADIGTKVQDALRRGEDPIKAATDAGTNATKTITTNAAASGGEGAHDVGTAVGVLKSVKDMSDKAAAVKKMKKK